MRRLAYVEKRTYKTYESYIREGSAEVAANAIICLIHQANYLVDRQLQALEQAFLRDGGFTERLSRMWLNYQNDVIRRGMINRLEMADFGGNLPVQVYWQGMFRLEPGQALILALLECPAGQGPHPRAHRRRRTMADVEALRRQGRLST